MAKPKNNERIASSKGAGCEGGTARKSASVKDGAASIDRRITKLKLSGRQNRMCANLWKNLNPAERKQVDLLVDVGLYALFELKDALYGDDLPDTTVDFRRLVTEGGHVALGNFSPADQVISLDPIAALGHEDAAKEILETLAHELVHYWCHHKGISDGEEIWSKAKNGPTWFHNARFRRAAREHGLECGLGEGGLRGNGFDRTSLSDDAWELIHARCPVTMHYLAEAERNFL